MSFLHDCLIPMFAHASTGSPPKATRLRTSSPQFLPCILPVAPSASPTLGATGGIHGPTTTGTRTDRSSLESISATPALGFFHACVSQLRFPAVTEEDKEDGECDGEQRQDVGIVTCKHSPTANPLPPGG